MAGRKQTPCDFCESEILESRESENGHRLFFEAYPDTCTLYVSSYANNESGDETELEFEIEMNFCPVCGRKLGY